MKYDLIVIGAGPGGYPAAVAAANMGKKTAIIENRELGGTCLNRGCIPTKTLLHTSELYHRLKDAEKIGLGLSGAVVDMHRLQERKTEVILSLREGISKLLKQNKVELYQGTGMITDAHKVNLRKEDGEVLELEAEYILAAVGSTPAMPPIPGANLLNVVDSDALLEKKELYERLLVIGGGVIGMEFATIYSDFGRQVTVIEAMDRILPGMDKEISQNLKMILKKRGVDIHTGAKVTSILEKEGCLCCIIEEKGTESEIKADGILIAAGRHANTGGLFAENLQVQMDRGNIIVDEHFRTNISGVYAIGDAIGGIQLAHMAAAEGENAAAYMFGEELPKNLKTVPACVYTNPEIATVGMTAEEAKEAGILVNTGKYIMSVNGKSLLSMEERGFIKIVSEKESGKIIGAQMMCGRATDMIGELALAITKGLTRKDVASVIMAHPTFSEGISEAAKN